MNKKIKHRESCNLNDFYLDVTIPRTCNCDYEKRKRAAFNKRARDEAYKSCGLVKVKGALGGTYWE